MLWNATTATVYSKPGCQQYKISYSSLDHAGNLYGTVDLTTNTVALEYVQGLGYPKIQSSTTTTTGQDSNRPNSNGSDSG